MENIRKMFHNRFFAQRTHIFPDKFCVIFFHLPENFLTQKITWLQLICKTLSVLVIEKCPFTTDRFGNQKSSARLMRIKCCRMNLYVIKMFKNDLMFHRNSKAVTGNMRKVRGVLIKASKSTACQYNVGRMYRVNLILLIHDNHTAANIVVRNQIDHRHVFTDFDVISGACLFK